MSAATGPRGRINRETQDSRRRPKTSSSRRSPSLEIVEKDPTGGIKEKKRPANNLNKEQRRAKIVQALGISTRAKHEFWGGVINPYTVHSTLQRALIYAPATKQTFTLEPRDELILGGFHGVQYSFKYLQDEVVRTVAGTPRGGAPLSLNEELLLVQGLIHPEGAAAHTLTKAVWKRTINALELPSHLWWDSTLQQPFSQDERLAKVLRWRHSTFLDDYALESLNFPSRQAAREKAQKEDAARRFPTRILHPFLSTLPISDLFVLVHEKARKQVPVRAPHSFIVALAIGLYESAYELLSSKALPFQHINEYAQIRGKPARGWAITQALWRANSAFVNDQDARDYEDECKRSARDFLADVNPFQYGENRGYT